jgi:hypothetical protein
MKVGRYRRAWRSSFAIALAVAAACVAPSAQAAIERVNDGGFEAATCDASDCTDPAWAQGTTAGFATSTGPICRPGTGMGDNACTGQGSIPFSGATWARLGAGYKVTSMFDGGVIQWLDQTVQIPAGHSATLSFRLRIINASGPTGEFRVGAGEASKVQNGEAPVFTATDARPGFASYAPVTIDLSSLAGTAPLLRFEGISSGIPVGALDSFDVDDISLKTVDPRCTTLRKKLKKAKSKKQKRKIRKLRKKMRALGC